MIEGNKRSPNAPVQEKDKRFSLEFNKSWGHRIALMLTDSFGSMQFLGSCLAFMALWIAWNLGAFSSLKPFDKFPFPLLSLLAALFALILSITVLISQNREGKLESVRQEIEFEVNVRAEKEVTKVLHMLHEIQQKLGIDRTDDVELEEMKESIDISELREKLTDVDENEQETRAQL